jgi:uncharacterized membrane protein
MKKLTEAAKFRLIAGSLIIGFILFLAFVGILMHKIFG